MTVLSYWSGSIIAVFIHIWPSPHWVDDDAFAAVTEEANLAERDIRQRLPTLETNLYLLVNQTSQVIPETGGGGFTIGPHVIRWDVDPSRGVEQVARRSLRSTLFHECHHAVRLQRRPEDASSSAWRAVAIFEGLASVFEDEAGQARPSWRSYDSEVIASWAEELFAQECDAATWTHWKFDHPDGRRNIAYKVGSWLVDEAVARSGRTPADLVWASPGEVIAIANCVPG